MRNQYLSLLFFKQHLFFVKISLNLPLTFNVNRGFQCSFSLCHLCVSKISAQFLNPYRSYFQHPAASRVHIQFQISPIFFLYYPRSSNKANAIVNGLNVTYTKRTHYQFVHLSSTPRYVSSHLEDSIDSLSGLICAYPHLVSLSDSPALPSPFSLSLLPPGASVMAPILIIEV